MLAKHILVHHRGNRPIRIHGIHAHEITNLLGFGLHGTRTQIEIEVPLQAEMAQKISNRCHTTSWSCVV